jgi:hypothetical protein
MMQADPQVVSLENVMEAAVDFGLTDGEVRRVLNGAMAVYASDGHSSSPDFLDEVCKAFALAILAKHRRFPSQRQL